MEHFDQREFDKLSNFYEGIFSLKDKVAIVTGGCGLLGREFISGLAQFGADIAFLDVADDSQFYSVQEIGKKFGKKIKGYHCDVSNESQVDLTISKILRDFGQIDILVNNAATKSENLSKFFAKVEDYSSTEWRKILDTNLNGMFFASQAVGRYLVRQGNGGSIIQISSIYGVMAPDQRIYEGSHVDGIPLSSPAVYSASKAGVIGLSKYLAAYWATSSIRVNTISPGGVKADQGRVFIEKYSSRVPMGRMAEASDIVGAVIYLASNASKYMTGQNLIVDGGLECW